MFTPQSIVKVTQLDEPQWKSKYWQLDAPLVYKAKSETFTVDPPFPTDFASVPRVFVWFLPRYGRYTRAAILHDSLWKRAQAGEMKWRDADGIFRRAMRELRVPFLRRWIMWTAVRWGALKHVNSGGATDWWKDAPAVLLFTVIAAPIVLPPAAVILVALVVFFVYEALVWLALLAGRKVKAIFGRKSPKELNPPALSLKTT